MSADIFGDRFVSNRVAAWHNIGTVADEPMSALAALELMGEPLVTKEPLTLEVNGQAVELDKQVIVRHPTPDDDEYVPFGIVGPNYELITAGDLCTIWDEFVGKPVETTGFLRRGALFFVTSSLPAIDVKGDEVEMYLGAIAPVDGGKMASCETWPLRVVCANTLRAAQDRAVDVYRVEHTKNAKVRMGEWLLDMYTRAEENTAILKEAFEILAGKSIQDEEAKAVLKVAYKDPKLPRQEAPEAVRKDRMASWEYWMGRVQVYRDGAFRLFQGEGTGMYTKAAKGTAWGLYNAVVECEDYRKGWNGTGLESQRVSESALLGERSETKQRAYSALMDLVKAG